jgi:hypothetical protein
MVIEYSAADLERLILSDITNRFGIKPIAIPINMMWTTGWMRPPAARVNTEGWLGAIDNVVVPDRK